MDDIGDILWRASFVIVLGIQAVCTSWIKGLKAHRRDEMLRWMVQDLKDKGIVEAEGFFVQWP